MSDSITPDPRMTNALDFAGLAQMRAGAVEGDEKVTKEVAQQFEAIFINMMLKSMREATDRSGLLDSETTKTYESMFDQQLSTELSANGTFGIAQALQNQLNQSPAAKTEGGTLPLPKSKGYELRQNNGAYELQRLGRSIPLSRGER
ncbi:MAG: rod-binding protein [Pseudomonadota bacterium]|nr:rod-binding protein [Pseudomonadota bacterium]MEC8492197.1 rod-binding protein [Pseudomonadota bacterium]